LLKKNQQNAQKYIFSQFIAPAYLVDGRIILKWIFERFDGGGIDCIDLAQDRDGWRAFVITVMNLSGSIKCGEFLQ
jgi:hypothetical protein